MPNSNRGFGRGNGTITVIEEPVMRSYRRKAKIVFYVTWFITAVLAATVIASKWHPLIALFAGVVLGVVTGAAAEVIVAAWPVIRAIWWWTPETVLTGSLVFGWIELADHTTLPTGWPSPPPSSASRPPSSRSGPGSTRRCGAWSPGTASGPAFPNSSSPTAPAACR